MFYSGKISSYITWIVLLLMLSGIPLLDRIIWNYNDFISYILLVTGLCFTIISMINLGKSTRLGLPSDATMFKTEGLYRISRNPMYVGFNLLTIASMMYTLNVWIAAIGIYSIVTYHCIILGEEKFMEGRFGTEYIEYRNKVRRYL